MSNEEIEVQAEIDAIKVELISYGSMFYGNSLEDAAAIAEDWYDCGFTFDQVDRWCAAGCWTPSVAAEFRDAYMTPRIAVKACELYDERHGTDSMYAACNNDLNTADIIAEHKAS